MIEGRPESARNKLTWHGRRPILERRMSSRRRSAAAAGLRSRRVPPRSRVTVRRREAPLVRSTSLATALRDSRTALSSLEGELDAILNALRSTDGAPPATAADRLHNATRTAAAAVASLGAFTRR
jgi:hypothetical protein